MPCDAGSVPAAELSQETDELAFLPLGFRQSVEAGDDVDGAVPVVRVDNPGVVVRTIGRAGRDGSGGNLPAAVSVRYGLASSP